MKPNIQNALALFESDPQPGYQAAAAELRTYIEGLERQLMETLTRHMEQGFEVLNKVEDLAARLQSGIDVQVCPTCKGTGNMVDWSRALRQHVENPDYPCETCKGAKYVVVSHWREEHSK